jgi:hypothetical protein
LHKDNCQHLKKKKNGVIYGDFLVEVDVEEEQEEKENHVFHEENLVVEEKQEEKENLVVEEDVDKFKII